MTRLATEIRTVVFLVSVTLHLPPAVYRVTMATKKTNVDENHLSSVLKGKAVAFLVRPPYSSIQERFVTSDNTRKVCAEFDLEKQIILFFEKAKNEVAEVISFYELKKVIRGDSPIIHHPRRYLNVISRLFMKMPGGPGCELKIYRHEKQLLKLWFITSRACEKFRDALNSIMETYHSQFSAAESISQAMQMSPSCSRSPNHQFLLGTWSKSVKMRVTYLEHVDPLPSFLETQSLPENDIYNTANVIPRPRSLPFIMCGEKFAFGTSQMRVVYESKILEWEFSNEGFLC